MEVHFDDKMQAFLMVSSGHTNFLGSEASSFQSPSCLSIDLYACVPSFLIPLVGEIAEEELLG